MLIELAVSFLFLWQGNLSFLLVYNLLQDHDEDNNNNDP